MSDERLRRWRLVLGSESQSTIDFSLSDIDRAMDGALMALYEPRDPENDEGSSRKKRGDLGSSAPNVARWLGDIRTYFPTPVVRIMQKDALERFDLHRMLLEPEMLEAVEPDVHLVATLLALKGAIPEKTKETARLVVRRVVEDLERRLAQPLRQAVRGSLDRATRTTRPRHNEIDWNRTIRLNLKHYIPEHRTLIPERLVGYGRRRSSLRDIILCIDQSGSMASSVVYASVFGAVLASIRAVDTRMVVFDTAVVDLSEDLDDPVDLLFGTQLGGGTDIDRAMAYCQGLVRRPEETILVLISDLYEGGNAREMIKRVASIVASGVTMVALLSLSDDGAPAYDHGMASTFAALGVPAFACTPEIFPELMAAAIARQDLTTWAAAHDIVAAPRSPYDLQI